MFAGLYKCRADFRRSPTKHALWNLTVIVPPHPPTIYSGDGKRMRTSLGPYKVGVTLVATCVNNGGLPPPALSWWRAHRMIDDDYEEVILEMMIQLNTDNYITDQFSPLLLVEGQRCFALIGRDG